MTDAGKLRLDKWLWFARFFKTRSLSAKQVADGHVRINGARVTKPSASVSPGDMLTFLVGKQVRVVKVAELGTRRGPASEAQSLYIDHSPPPPEPTRDPNANPAFDGKGRPTKKDRRRATEFRSFSDE